MRITARAGVIALAILAIGGGVAEARSAGGARPYYGGGHHTGSHGGHYAGGVGRTHRGGHYRNLRTNNSYGRHR